MPTTRRIPKVTVQYFLNHELCAEEVEKHIRLMAEVGIECVLVHPRQGLRTPWLSREWDSITRLIYKTAKSVGMDVAIWDEFPFPSGNAGGLVVAEHPEYAGRHLEFTVVPVTAGVRVYAFPRPKESNELGRLVGAYTIHHRGIRNVTDQCGPVSEALHMPRYIARYDYQISTNAYQNPHFRWVNSEHGYALYLENPEDFPAGHVVGVVEYRNAQEPFFFQTDLLRREAVEYFVERTYGHYWDLAQAEGVIPAFAFTDEPGPNGDYPWTPAFPEEFESDHGYDLQDWLPHVLLDIDESSPRIRVDYRKTLGRLYAENYLGTLSRWCKRRSIPLGGHLPRLDCIAEWPGTPYKFRAHEAMDIPTHDPIGDNLSREDLVLRTLAVGTAASAARLFGKTHVMSDSFALLPDSTSLRELKAHADWQMFAGINCFAVHNFSYSIAGPRKDEAPPSYFYHQPWFAQSKRLYDYVRSVCEYLEGSARPCDTVLLLPDTAANVHSNDSSVEVKWGRRLGATQALVRAAGALLDSHVMFGLIDEQGIVDAEVREGHLASYSPFEQIILPALDFIEPATARKLEGAARAGVKVVCLGKVPQVLPEKVGVGATEWTAASIERVDEDSIEGLACSRVGLSGEGQEQVWVSRISKDGKQGAYLYNTSFAPFRGRVQGGAEVELLGRSGLLVKDLEKADQVPTPVPRGPDVSVDRFRIVFGDNQCPLHVWHKVPCGETAWSKRFGMRNDEEIFAYFPTVDLYQPRSMEVLGEDTHYVAKFLVCGQIDGLRLVTEPLEGGRMPTVFVNDRQITGFEKTADFDVMDQSADISAHIKSGAVPMLNIIKVKVEAGAWGLSDSPILVGPFEVHFGHALPGLPTLKASDSTHEDVLPNTWASLGRMFYSGTARYQFVLDVPRTRALQPVFMDLGRVETAAEIRVDGASRAFVFCPPYRAELGMLGEGQHTVDMEVTNTLANRLRGQWRDSGLLTGAKLWFGK